MGQSASHVYTLTSLAHTGALGCGGGRKVHKQWLGAGESEESSGTLNISLEATCRKTNTKLYLIGTILSTEIPGSQITVPLFLLKQNKTNK